MVPGTSVVAIGAAAVADADVKRREPAAEVSDRWRMSDEAETEVAVVWGGCESADVAEPAAVMTRSNFINRKLSMILFFRSVVAREAARFGRMQLASVRFHSDQTKLEQAK